MESTNVYDLHALVVCATSHGDGGGIYSTRMCLQCGDLTVSGRLLLQSPNYYSLADLHTCVGTRHSIRAMIFHHPRRLPSLDAEIQGIFNLLVRALCSAQHQVVTVKS